MGEEPKCFVCQSKSSQSADGGSSAKRRKPDNYYNNLDSSIWRIFWHYFYPPPLVCLLDSSSSNSPEDFSLPVFCGACCQTILNLCNLHHQLELIQSQISKIVAQVSLAFVQEEKNHDNGENCNRISSSQRKLRKTKNQQCDEDVIFSMRRCIRQRYQPSVCLQKSNLDTPKQNFDDGNSNIDLQLDSGEFSPLSINSNNVNLDLDFDVDRPRPIKQEVEDSLYQATENEQLDVPEHLNDTSINIKSDLAAVDERNGKKVKKKRNKSKGTNEQIEDNEDEDDSNNSHQEQPSESDSDYEPDNDSDYNFEPVKSKKVSIPKSKRKKQSQRTVKVKIKVKEKPTIKKKRANWERHTLDKKVGENIYEYGGKWRYEKKLDEHGKRRVYCLTCNHSNAKRRDLVIHIEEWHSKESGHRTRRTQKIDENNFIYDGIYSITKVTEPNGIFFKCGACGALKKNLEMVKGHLKDTHIDAGKWICELCGYSCSTKRKLDDHMEVHVEVKKYICEECGNLFKSKDSLRVHMDRHAATPFICECGATCRYRSTLAEHRRKFNHPAPKVVPTPDAPYAPKPCPICKRLLVSEENFQKHLSICKGNVKSPCDWCGGIFLKVNVHKRKSCKERFNKQGDGDTVPVPEKPTFRKTCDSCNKEFVYQGYYERHVTTCGRKKHPDLEENPLDVPEDHEAEKDLDIEDPFQNEIL